MGVGAVGLLSFVAGIISGYGLAQVGRNRGESPHRRD